MSWSASDVIAIAGWVFGGIGTLVVIVWRARPQAEKFVDKRVAAAVAPVLEAVKRVSDQLDEQEEERLEFHSTTTTELARISGSLLGLRSEVDENKRGNERGKEGLTALGAGVDRIRLRVHDLELKTGIRQLGDAARENGEA